ncbi:MAG: hypothetical protein KDK08_27625 [Rhizobiaceae bacterium]|nr:hypothetical protein [Rhizobiaceae bacterium]
MKAYPVFESEINSFSVFNGLAMISFSIASALFALAAGIITSAIFAETLTPAAAILTKFVAPILIIASLVALVVGLVANVKRANVWSQIQKETKG